MDSGMNKAIQALQHENIKLKDRMTELEEENRALKAYLRGVSSLNEATKNLATQDNLIPLLDEILYQALVVTNSDHGSLLLVDEETKELVFVVVHGEFRDRLQGYRISAEEGIAGWVAQNGEALIVNRAHFDSRFSAEIDREFGMHTNSILAAPLRAGSRIMGVLELINKQDGDYFTETDSTVLSLLGVFAALSLEQIERQLEAEPEEE